MLVCPDLVKIFIIVDLIVIDKTKFAQVLVLSMSLSFGILSYGNRVLLRHYPGLKHLCCLHCKTIFPPLGAICMPVGCVNSSLKMDVFYWMENTACHVSVNGNYRLK